MPAHPPRRLPAALPTALRVLGAIALVAVAADHLYEYAVDHYSVIPTIGTLFVLNGAGALTLAAVLSVPMARIMPGRPGRVIVPCAAVGGLVLSMTTLAGLLVSEHTPLFGFQEVGYRPVVVISIVAEATAIVALSLFLAVSRLVSEAEVRDPRSPTQHRSPATKPRSSLSRPSTKGVSMKRPLIAAPVVVVIAVAVGLVAGAFSSGSAPRAVAHSSMSMSMPMPASSSTAVAPLHLDLHRRVVKVRISNFAFVPARIEVSPGTRVVWTNEDQDPHTVTTDKLASLRRRLIPGRRTPAS